MNKKRIIIQGSPISSQKKDITEENTNVSFKCVRNVIAVMIPKGIPVEPFNKSKISSFLFSLQNKIVPLPHNNKKRCI